MTKMIISCPSCKAKLNLPDDRIKAVETRFKCAKCGALLSLRKKARESFEDDPVKNYHPTPPETSPKPIESQVSPPETTSSAGQALREPFEKTAQEGSNGRTPRDTAGLKEVTGVCKPKEVSDDNKGERFESGDDDISSEDIARVRELHKRYGFMNTATDRLEEKPFIQHLPDVIKYPLSGGGLFMLGVGAVFFSVLLFFSSYAFVAGMIGYVFVGGYLSSFMMKIVSHTADGEIDLPDWPDISDWWDDIICPMFEMVLVTLISYLPLVAYIVYGVSNRGLSPVATLSLLILGTLYEPMALISMSIHRSARALNPVLLAPAILKVPKDYLIACGVLFLIFILKWLFRYYVSIPLLGPLIDNFIMLYLLVVETRILGLIYYTNRTKFEWF